MRLASSFAVASVAVYLLGSVVKLAGFDKLLLVMALIACCSAGIVFWSPDESASQPAVETA